MRWYEKENVKKWILLTGITLAVYLFVQYILPVIIPFLLGGMLAMLLNPPVVWLVRKTGKSRGLMSLFVIALVLALTVTGCFFAGRALCAQGMAALRQADSIEAGMRDFWCGCCAWFSRGTGFEIAHAGRLFTQLEQKISAGVQTKLLPYLLKNSVFYARTFFSVLSIIFVSVISALFMLTDYPKLAKGIRSSQFWAFVQKIRKHAKEAGGTYIKAQLTILLFVSAVCVIGLFLAGNSYALLAGLGIGLCDALPFLGTGVVFVPWILIDVVQGKYVLAAVYGVLYVLCSLVRQLLEPRLIGKRLGCPPLIVLASIYIGIHVYGAGGVLSGPLSAFLIYESYDFCLSVKSGS